MEGRSRVSGLRPAGALFLPLQVLDSGRNDFGFKLRGAIAPGLAVMQVAIDLDKPSFGAHLDSALSHRPIYCYHEAGILRVWTCRIWGRGTVRWSSFSPIIHKMMSSSRSRREVEVFGFHSRKDDLTNESNTQ